MTRERVNEHLALALVAVVATTILAFA
jgi:hypothetical protein